MPIQLKNYESSHFNRGRPWLFEACWLIVRSICFSHLVPSSKVRVLALSLFGATIGAGVVIKPGVKVKFPWRLSIGEHSWIGEDVWIDNLGSVDIGSNSCVSQGVYICTGNHDWKSPGFDLIVNSVKIGDHSWIA